MSNSNNDQDLSRLGLIVSRIHLSGVCGVQCLSVQDMLCLVLVCLRFVVSSVCLLGFVVSSICRFSVLISRKEICFLNTNCTLPDFQTISLQKCKCTYTQCVKKNTIHFLSIYQKILNKRFVFFSLRAATKISRKVTRTGITKKIRSKFQILCHF